MFPEAARVFFHTSKYFVPQIPYSVACTLVNFSFHPPSAHSALPKNHIIQYKCHFYSLFLLDFPTILSKNHPPKEKTKKLSKMFSWTERNHQVCKSTCCYQTRKNPTLSYSMWNSLPLPFVCEIHKLKCPPKFLKKHTHPKRCLYYNHLPHNPISAARRQKNYYKKEALALTESKQSRYSIKYHHVDFL